jgi:hypothetical protein
MIKIRFDNGITVTIRGGFVEAPSPTLTAILDTLAATLPPFEANADFQYRPRHHRENRRWKDRGPGLFAEPSRILAATVDDDAALDAGFSASMGSYA